MTHNSSYEIKFLESVKVFLGDMPEADRAKTAAAITVMSEGKFDLISTKVLKSPIRELIIKKYRFIFFIEGNLIHFIHSFIKKTAKTPRKEIEYAEKIYKIITNK